MTDMTEASVLLARPAIPYGRFAHYFGRAAIYSTLGAIGALQAFPLVWLVVTAFKNPREVFNSFLPSQLDFSNFVRVWSNLNLPRHLINSLYVTSLTVAITLAAATLAGYVFARFRFFGRDALFYIFLAAMMIPSQTILIPMFQFLKQIGLINTLTGLSFSYLGSAVAFSVFLMRSFFVSLPKELGDAARMDGAGEFRTFWYVYLPLAKSGVATVVIIQSMSVWNEFMFANTFISSPGLKTIQSAVFQAVDEFSTDYGALCAGLMLALMPIVIVFLVLQKQFVRGLTAGALKG